MIIIPARINSTRFPRKIFSDIFGIPMFIKSALNAQQVDDVILALDDDESMQIAKSYKIKAVLTDPNIENGTLRVLEAAKMLGLKNEEKIINLQADEPFLEPSVILELKNLLNQSSFGATLARYITSSEANNTNIVKVILDSNNNAIYFSRLKIPFNRDDKDLGYKYLGHLGLYGYSLEALKFLQEQDSCKLEELEQLEQLRAIYYKKELKVGIVETNSIGIDTKQDLLKALEVFKGI